jgi:CheY-like chemotaxis protein
MNQSMNTETQIHPERSVENAAGSHPGLAPPTKKRILLADDSPQVRESLGKVLRNAGYHVTPVAHGGQALDRALEGEFDLLLLDLNMPGMDGWETLDHLASLKPALPVIIITAQPNQRDWAAAEGARALMEKPLDLPLLLQTIRDFTTESSVGTARHNAGLPARFSFAAPVKNEFQFSDSSRRWTTN